jgi:VanZ family protein
MKIAGLPTRSLHGAVIAIVLLAILAATLTPSGNGYAPFAFALTFARRGLADGILNFCLFLPLGLAIGWSSRRAVVVGLSGLLLATAIELAQTLVPGRDPALSDIIFNTVGTLMGEFIARRQQAWLTPSLRGATVFTASGIVAASLVMISTAVLLSPLEKPVFIARSGNDLLLRYQSRAHAFGLDQPEYWSLGAFQQSASGGMERVTVSRDRAHWQVRIGRRQATLGPTIGQGWAVLAYPDKIGRRWGNLVSAAWMFAMCLPIGFWARERLALIAGGVLIVVMALIPVITGVVATSPVEWVGALVGFLAGALLGQSSRRRWQDQFE